MQKLPDESLVLSPCRVGICDNIAAYLGLLADALRCMYMFRDRIYVPVSAWYDVRYSAIYILQGKIIIYKRAPKLLLQLRDYCKKTTTSITY